MCSDVTHRRSGRRLRGDDGQQRFLDEAADDVLVALRDAAPPDRLPALIKDFMPGCRA